MRLGEYFAVAMLFAVPATLLAYLLALVTFRSALVPRSVQKLPEDRIRRWFLLYKPISRWAWPLRLYFYFFAIVTPASVFALPFTGGFDWTNKQNLFAAVEYDLIAIFSGSVCSIPFRILSKVIEGPRPIRWADILLGWSPAQSSSTQL